MSSWLRTLGLEFLWPVFVTEGVDAEALVSVLRISLACSCWEQSKNFSGIRPERDSEDGSLKAYSSYARRSTETPQSS